MVTAAQDGDITVIETDIPVRLDRLTWGRFHTPVIAALGIYALVLGRFFAVPADRIGLYILPFAAGNFLGSLLLGPLFDRIGRKPMIVFTYAMSGLLLLVTALLFVNGARDVVGQTLAWSVVFFFASAASSAYLTAGEYFPLEMRALAIAIFYALGTALGAAVTAFTLCVAAERRPLEHIARPLTHVD